eukprot:g2154.t1
MSGAWSACGAMAAGFFAWDLWLCARHRAVFGAGMVLHAALCLSAYVTTAYLATFSWAGAFALLYEASTPFLNARFALVKAGRTAGPWARPFFHVQLGFMLSFFVARVVGGVYFVRHAWFWPERCVPWLLRVQSVFVVGGTTALNFFWFGVIVQGAIEHTRSAARVQKLGAGAKKCA